MSYAILMRALIFLNYFDNITEEEPKLNQRVEITITKVQQGKDLKQNYKAFV